MAIAAGCGGGQDSLCWPTSEIPWDGLDQDCDGADLVDVDGDGFPTGQDCDDLNPRVNPGATDRPYDGLDQDCAGGNDFDVDGDGDEASGFGGTDCEDTDPGLDGLDGDGDHFSSCLGDCDDENAEIHPLAEAICGDEIDNDCDGRSDCGYRGALDLEDLWHAQLNTGRRDVGATMVVGDFDDDGQGDFLAGTPYSADNHLSWGPLDGDLVWSDGPVLTGVTHDLVAGDLNDDGYTDAVFGTNTLDSHYFLGPWAEGATTVQYPLGTADHLKIGDFDDDGGADLLTVHPEGIYVFYGPPERWLEPGARSLLNSTPTVFIDAWDAYGGDLDADGVDDLLWSQPFQGTYLISGPIPQGTLADPQDLRVLLVEENIGFAVLDGDGDGRPDLVSTRSELEVYDGPLPSTAGPTWLGAAPTGHPVSLGDFDGDGFEDLATVPMQQLGHTVFLLYGPLSGPIGFDPKRQAQLQVGDLYIDGFTVGEVSGDALPDLLLSITPYAGAIDDPYWVRVLPGLPSGY